jgi:hypothetical protein
MRIEHKRMGKFLYPLVYVSIGGTCFSFSFSEENDDFSVASREHGMAPSWRPLSKSSLLLFLHDCLLCFALLCFALLHSFIHSFIVATLPKGQIDTKREQ